MLVPAESGAVTGSLVQMTEFALMSLPACKCLRFFPSEFRENELRKSAFPSNCLRFVQRKPQEMIVNSKLCPKLRQNVFASLIDSGHEALAEVRATANEGGFLGGSGVRLIGHFHVYFAFE